jgi:hypothetical protein
VSEHPIAPEAIDAALTAALDYAPEENEGPGAMQAAIRAADEKRRFRVTPEATALLEAEGKRFVLSTDEKGLRLDVVDWPEVSDV